MKRNNEEDDNIEKKLQKHHIQKQNKPKNTKQDHNEGKLS